MSLSISQTIFEQMIAHLTAVYPQEGCGLLAGTAGMVTRYYPIENIHHSPIAYEMNPSEQISAFLDAEARGEEIVAIYHSHPQGPERPSPTDIAQATYPELIYLICSLKNKAHPTIGGFAIVDQTVTDVSIHIL